MKEFFANSIIVDDVNGFDNTIVTPFKERIEGNGLSVQELNMVSVMRGEAGGAAVNFEAAMN